MQTEASGTSGVLHREAAHRTYMACPLLGHSSAPVARAGSGLSTHLPTSAPLWPSICTPSADVQWVVQVGWTDPACCDEGEAFAAAMLQALAPFSASLGSYVNMLDCVASALIDSGFAMLCGVERGWWMLVGVGSECCPSGPLLPGVSRVQVWACREHAGGACRAAELGHPPCPVCSGGNDLRPSSADGAGGWQPGAPGQGKGLVVRSALGMRALGPGKLTLQGIADSVGATAVQTSSQGPRWAAC